MNTETAFKAWQDRSISDFQLIRMLKAENDRLEKEISRLEAEIKKIIYDDEGN